MTGVKAGGRPPCWLLWDVENCAAPRDQARAFLHAMLAVAGPVDRVLAAAEAHRLRRYRRDLLAASGSGPPVEFLAAPREPDGAERVLLAAVPAGAPLRLVIASHDHAFAALAAAGHTLVVVSPTPQRVAADLRACATVRAFRLGAPAG